MKPLASLRLSPTLAGVGGEDGEAILSFFGTGTLAAASLSAFIIMCHSSPPFILTLGNGFKGPATCVRVGARVP